MYLPFHITDDYELVWTERTGLSALCLQVYIKPAVAAAAGWRAAWDETLTQQATFKLRRWSENCFHSSDTNSCVQLIVGWTSRRTGPGVRQEWRCLERAVQRTAAVIYRDSTPLYPALVSCRGHAVHRTCSLSDFKSDISRQIGRRVLCTPRQAKSDAARSSSIIVSRNGAEGERASVGKWVGSARCSCDAVMATQRSD